MTHGPPGARQHIWTFAGALNEVDPSYNRQYNCPCSNINVTWPYQLPAFIGSNHFCDTGNYGRGWSISVPSIRIISYGMEVGVALLAHNIVNLIILCSVSLYLSLLRKTMEIRICSYLES